MKFSHWFAALACGVMVLAAGTAFGQQPAEPQRELKQLEAKQREAQPRDAASKHGIVRSSQVIGMSLENNKGEAIGSVDDVVVDMNSGRIRYAAIRFGGFLGVGDKLFAIPWEALKIKPQQDESGAPSHVVLYDVSEQELEKAPGFPADSWPDFADAKFTAGIDEYYRGDKPAEAPREKRKESSDYDAVFRTSEVAGLNVYNRENKELGSISELVFDLNQGKVRYAAMSYGGFLGIGDKLFAVPVSKIAVQQKNGAPHLVMNVDIETLKNAEGFDQNNWPDTAAPNWSKMIDEYYGVDRGEKEAAK